MLREKHPEDTAITETIRNASFAVKRPSDIDKRKADHHEQQSYRQAKKKIKHFLLSFPSNHVANGARHLGQRCSYVNSGSFLSVV